MHIAIVEPDELMAHILAFVARRRGHKTFIAPDVDDLPERLPFTPTASIVALDASTRRASRASSRCASATRSR